MHLRGKSFEFRAEKDSGSEILLEVPAYDFNWQHNYELSTPMPLDQVDTLSFSAAFDNSADNPFNPDASEVVMWGDQTWQEMAVTFISIARPLAEPVQSQRKESTHAEQELFRQQTEQREREATTFADRYIERFDRNGDGSITSGELPDSVRMFSYWQLDLNGDGQIAHEEIYRQALQRAEDEGRD
jgi:hypothetical protein